MRDRRFFNWLRACAQTTTYLGVVMIVVIWSGAFFLASDKREYAYENAQRQGSNLARIFAEYVSRVINGTDSQLLVLRELYQAKPQVEDLAHWVNNATLKNDLAAQFALAGPDGNVMFSSVGPITSPINIGDRPHFLAHVNSTSDELNISVPIVGRVSGKSTINLTRRLSAPDGSFAGIIIASLDIEKLEKFYGSIDVDKGGVLSLVGFDTIIRIRSARIPQAQNYIGKSIAGSKLFEIYKQHRSGSYWNTAVTSRQFEGVSRLISYRVLDGIPLIAVVGLADSDILLKATAETQQYYMITAILTAFVLVVMDFVLLRKKNT
jgi:hypothetical protein